VIIHYGTSGVVRIVEDLLYLEVMGCHPSLLRTHFIGDKLGAFPINDYYEKYFFSFVAIIFCKNNSHDIGVNVWHNLAE